MDPNEQPSWTGADGPDKEKMEQVSYPSAELWSPSWLLINLQDSG